MAELHQRGAAASFAGGSNSQPAPTASPSQDSRWSKTFKLLFGPLLMYSVLVGISGLASIGVFGNGYYLQRDEVAKKTIFSWHPLLMVLGFITLAGNAVLIKKVKGLENMRLHGNLMSGAIISVLLGWWAIYDTKVFYKRLQPFSDKSLHGQIGIAVMIGYLMVGFGGFIAFHPEYGVPSLKSNQTVRLIHKWAGRVLTALSWYCCVLGARKSFAKYSMDNGVAIPSSYLWLELPLIIIGYFVLI